MCLLYRLDRIYNSYYKGQQGPPNTSKCRVEQCGEVIRMASEDSGLDLDPTEFSKATVQLETALSLAEQGSSKTVDKRLRAKATPAGRGMPQFQPHGGPDKLSGYFHYQHGWEQKAP